MEAFVAEFAGGVEFALHDVIFFVDGRQAGFGFDENQSIHTISDVDADGSGGAVIDVKAGV